MDALMSVPTMEMAAPNSSLTMSHSTYQRKRAPNFAKVGQAGFDDAPEAVLEEMDGEIEGDGAQTAEHADEGGREQQKDIFAAARPLDPGTARAPRPARENNEPLVPNLGFFRIEGHGGNCMAIGAPCPPENAAAKMGWIREGGGG